MQGLQLKTALLVSQNCTEHFSWYLIGDEPFQHQYQVELDSKSIANFCSTSTTIFLAPLQKSLTKTFYNGHPIHTIPLKTMLKELSPLATSLSTQVEGHHRNYIHNSTQFHTSLPSVSYGNHNIWVQTAIPIIHPTQRSPTVPCGSPATIFSLSKPHFPPPLVPQRSPSPHPFPLPNPPSIHPIPPSPPHSSESRCTQISYL